VKIKQTGVSTAVIVGALVLGGWFGEASAQQPTPEQIAAIRQSCRSDFMSHCAGVQPGGREALQCLKRNAGSVSAPCKTALDAVGPKPAAGGAEPAAAPAPAPAPAAAPAANTQEPAAEAPPPAAPAEPAAAAPNPPAETPPGPGPSEATTPGAPQVAAVRAACRSDFGVHCPGVRPGGAAALRCLQVNAAALSPRCRSAVEAMGEGAGAPPPAAAAPEAPAGAPPPGAVAPLGPIPPMMPRQAVQILSFCGQERWALCGDVPPGGGRIIECLAQNAPRLSPQCYGAIARAIR
jgi:hypothetical protein